MPKQTYSILKSAADDTLGKLYIVAEGLPTRAAALNAAKTLKLVNAAHKGSWPDTYYICILESV